MRSALVYSWNAGDFRWKNAKKTQKDRVVYLTPALQEMVEGEIAARGGVGPIFRTIRRSTWTANNLVNRMMVLLELPPVVAWCEENDFDRDKVMCYGFRHSYITRMLQAGCPIKILADLCGTSVCMIEKNYSKVHDDHLAMRRLYLQFTDASGRPPP